jgi:anti-sigma regulatory factor (Ser/Thr protein kinase)
MSNGGARPASLTVPARPEFVHAASAFVMITAKQLGAGPSLPPLFEVAIGEALANAVKHGSQGRPNASVTCEVEGEGAGLLIRILDEGEGFSPRPVALPDASALDIADVPESGYGLPIIHTVFKGVHTCRNEGRFCLELTFHDRA